MKENLGLAYEIILLTEINKGNLKFQELLALYFSLKAYSHNLEPRDSIRLKSQLQRITKLIKRERHLQKQKPSLSEEYLSMKNN